MGLAIITRRSYVDPVFANNTWAQIIQACESGSVPDTWAVGDQKVMTMGDRDYPIDIIGRKHDVYSDGSGIAPLTFQLHTTHYTTAGMNTEETFNYNGWSQTRMRLTLLPGSLFLGKMPTEVQAGLKEVDKLSYTNHMSSASEYLCTTADKLFLLAESEIFSTIEYADGSEGEQYEYYAQGNSAKKTKIGSSTATSWWTRSTHDGTSYAYVSTSGSAYHNASAGSYATSRGVAFAFCF